MCPARERGRRDRPRRCSRTASRWAREAANAQRCLQGVSSDLVRDERSLLRRARGGESEAFGVLVQRHDDRLRGPAFRLPGSGERMDDVLQGAYLRAFRALRGFRGEAELPTWLYRIVYTTCLDELRRGGREAAWEPAEMEGRHDRGWEEGPVRQLDLAAASAALPAEDRAAALPVDGSGLDYRSARRCWGCRRGWSARVRTAPGRRRARRSESGRSPRRRSESAGARPPTAIPSSLLRWPLAVGRGPQRDGSGASCEEPLVSAPPAAPPGLPGGGRSTARAPRPWPSFHRREQSRRRPALPGGASFLRRSAGRTRPPQPRRASNELSGGSSAARCDVVTVTWEPPPVTSVVTAPALPCRASTTLGRRAAGRGCRRARRASPALLGVELVTPSPPAPSAAGAASA